MFPKKLKPAFACPLHLKLDLGNNNEQRRHSLPIEIQLALRHGAVSQIEIDKALVRNTNVFGDCLEVRDGIFVKTNRDLFFEL